MQFGKKAPSSIEITFVRQKTKGYGLQLWHFNTQVDTINGTESSAIIYSIVETAKENQLKRHLICQGTRVALFTVYLCRN